VKTDRPWYQQYEQLRTEVFELRRRFLHRCLELGADPGAVLAQFWREITIRAVHESNWQEGIYVEKGKTKELAEAAFDELEEIKGPHLDMNKVLRFHRDAVVRLRERGAAPEEIAAANLSKAHIAITWIGYELGNRVAASLAQCVRELEDIYEHVKENSPAETQLKLKNGFEVLQKVLTNSSPPLAPMTGIVPSEGALASSLIALDFDELIQPMRVDYIHFLHKLLLIGLIPVGDAGRFRNVQVHVGNPDLYFPPPLLVPKLMLEYCRNFPTILPSTVKYDPILKAAEISHKFVRIHPYIDGNGRVSRLLMNLVLWGHFPPVYLKADKKGRHRYGQALKRADRGNIQPLAALIAMSLIEIYKKIVESIQRRK
jgi:fido (protein-threonine AMPylation protein)